MWRAVSVPKLKAQILTRIIVHDDSSKVFGIMVCPQVMKPCLQIDARETTSIVTCLRQSSRLGAGKILTFVLLFTSRKPVHSRYAYPDCAGVSSRPPTSIMQCRNASYSATAGTPFSRSIWTCSLIYHQSLREN